MEKNPWLDFIPARLRAQISLENSGRFRTWALALVSLAALGWAIQATGGINRRVYFSSLKVLFIAGFHLLLVFGLFIPGFLQKGEKWLARLLGVRDFTALALISIAMTFYACVVAGLSFQAVDDVVKFGGTGFFQFAARMNAAVTGLYFAGWVVSFLMLFFTPQALAKISEWGGRAAAFFLGLHALLAVFLCIGYAEMVSFGSALFLEQVRIAGLFWMFIGGSVLWLGRMLDQSSVPSLAALEVEIAAGRLKHTDDVIARLKESFVHERLFFWTRRLSHRVATAAHEIARYAHEAVTLVSAPKPAESELRQVEEKYRRADGLYKRLEKENQRFLFNAALFDVNEVEREKIEELRDQYSREIRSAKIELTSVRKKIDQRLEALKNSEGVMPAPGAESGARAEKVPLSS